MIPLENFLPNTHYDTILCAVFQWNDNNSNELYISIMGNMGMWGRCVYY